ncbi:hypothetical protein K7X08_010105 [Anisodus acutangulus]|uniref:RNA polymerase sigma-70 domain-containing protein n=1 Tax=Anisodus acutangulus TaxID=402998 RepID=A0A9Q1N6K1_9SOLA|nr:hypothetical protein K7X08_010105 [Anisodus acutangulus]
MVEETSEIELNPNQLAKAAGMSRRKLDKLLEGSTGLLHGAKKFNPKKGYKLSTYAYWWIRQAITRAIANKSRVIRSPGSISELVPRICNANTELSRKLQRIPSYDEIAEALGPEDTTPEEIVKRQMMKQDLEKVLKLHFGLNGDTPQTFEEIGRVLKLSREGIRQINCTALSKLRESTMLDSFKMYIT